MLYKIVKEIISLKNASEKEKLDMIEEIADRFALIDKYAKEKSYQEGRDLTLDDQYEATLRVASEYNLPLDTNKDNFTGVIKDGIKYIIESQTDNGGWGRTQKKRVPERLRTIINSDAIFPLESTIKF